MEPTEQQPEPFAPAPQRFEDLPDLVLHTTMEYLDAQSLSAMVRYSNLSLIPPLSSRISALYRPLPRMYVKRIQV